MHHADATGLIHFQRVGMLHQCSTGELLAGAALVHHETNEHEALRHHAVLKGLMCNMCLEANVPGPLTCLQVGN